MAEKSAKVTIQDVAKQAGVSTATVSRMINENGFVSTEARKAIQAVIKATGYNPTRRRRQSEMAASALKNSNATLIWTTSQEMQMSNSGRDMMLGLTEGLRKINASLNVDYIELDVQKSSDDSLIVIHDATVDATTSYSGLVSSYSYNDLKLMDAGSWFSNDYIGTEIPKLFEVIAMADRKSVV